ncbi:hypothetical protein FB45DRAFT_892222 [Roridomyces roridus]|uniref:Brain protein I3 n=1 Tax=Roridomyces roridus TaxID=1738132 RepID=A0AAD7CES2_9AGAR|nr:hypothetical protein FB45DRAFT_892222 [Roridomyces roridus]
MADDHNNDAPPAYDGPSKDVKAPLTPTNIPAMNAGPAYVPSAGPSAQQPVQVYHYDNPITGEHVVSLLPPNHPEMICLQSGQHVLHTSYGLLGLLAAVFWFPLGIGLCLLDRRVKCTRCGRLVEDGVCA